MTEQGNLVRSKGSSFLNSFWDLVSDCSNTREQAATYITTYLANAGRDIDEQGDQIKCLFLIPFISKYLT